MDIPEVTKPRVFRECVPLFWAKCMSFADGAQVWMEPYNLAASNILLQDISVVANSPGMTHFAQKFGEAQVRVAAGQSHYSGGNLSPVLSFT